ncbi:uncharacterized protein B0J16DRAFT_388493 [Fusarium flagelliforme]|uniref:Nitrogen metabolite repression protein nmra n=1 Tax=Fusarium flagelliforme TaxID=2675880 RepID=A0A395M8H6_9HYPO|nr:uncharacterized protein B0J16DRAFT_388493 [Fusarium flagelliforme]KAH7174670.1 hypothetical protein B0J16DRAFT_388493 [Fusarium flagelliforme]RFN44184.1 nitrogen metabolite repression protein nmra [Fusarium flagelliforme]
MAAYLITQATGQQSQWAIKNLLEVYVTIHAIVRNLDKIPALLNSRNIILFHDESKNFDDVFKAAQGCTAVFLNTFPFPIVASASIFPVKGKFWDTEFIKIIIPELDMYYLSNYEVEEIVGWSRLQFYTTFRPAILQFNFYLL